MYIDFKDDAIKAPSINPQIRKIQTW